MSASQPDEEALFNAARRIGDVVARAQYIREAAAGNEALARRVEELLSVESLEDRRTPTAMFTVADVTVVEGNAGTRTAQVTVALTEPHGNGVTVSYATADASATAGRDYTAVAGKLTFAKNETSKAILVPIQGDRLAETDESFTVRLSNPKGAKVADGTGLVTIADDEPYVYLGAGYFYNPYASVAEGDDGTAAADFTVFLSGPSR